ncbi:MAG: mannitol dehydrogenase family protein, partial [Clostridia bacterium]|nr:mannitol dehydrogenase family protein [Clostridia bacterium]
MKLNLSELKNRKEWENRGIAVPPFDISSVRENTRKNPAWIHFGAGNIFRAFPAALLQRLLENGVYDRGVIVAEGFDYEIIDKVYRPYDSLSLLAVLKADGSVEKRIVASVTESLKADFSFPEDWSRLIDIFGNPSLQMISFTITEKGYGVNRDDFSLGLSPQSMMGKTALLLLERWKAGGYPVTLQSMDNCSHNGDKLRNGVLSYADAWVKSELVPKSFYDWLSDENTVAFPLSMIDKITPRPDETVRKMLTESGFEDSDIIVTSKNTFTAPFVNAEETEYLVIEDRYVNGRPPLEEGGVLFTDRETVEKVERMKVCTCLNPLHTAMSVYGCILGYSRISDEMRDGDIRAFITKMGYN